MATAPATNNDKALATRDDAPRHVSIVETLANKIQRDMDPMQFLAAVKATAMPANVNVSNEQLAAFFIVANQYGLNPLTKEIYAFPAKGGITPMVSIDGWLKLINAHPQFDGMTTEDIMGDDGKLEAVRCTIYRKDRAHPTVTEEFLAECHRPTEPWNKWPRRMLRHKAVMQCARYALGFAGIYDEDEAERIREVAAVETHRPAQIEVLDQPAGELDIKAARKATGCVPADYCAAASDILGRPVKKMQELNRAELQRVTAQILDDLNGASAAAAEAEKGEPDHGIDSDIVDEARDDINF